MVRILRMNSSLFNRLEVRKINTLLPSENEQQVIEGIPFIDPSDLQEYIKVYKYYPNYLEGQDTL